MTKNIKISDERRDELEALAVEHLSQREWFDYGDWDGIIEDEEYEQLTYDELRWLAKNYEVVVTLVKKT